MAGKATIRTVASLLLLLDVPVKALYIGSYLGKIAATDASKVRSTVESLYCERGGESTSAFTANGVAIRGSSSLTRFSRLAQAPFSRCE